MAKRKASRTIAAFTHGEAARKNIPTAEYQAVMEKADQSPIRVAYMRRNRDLDPQLVWRGKDAQDWFEDRAPGGRRRSRGRLQHRAPSPFYVACTRARDRLLVSGVAPASEFLDDLRADA